MDEKCTQAEYARRRDLSRQRVHQLVRDGRIPLDADGLVEVEQADVNLATMLDLRKANRERQTELAARARANAEEKSAKGSEQASIFANSPGPAPDAPENNEPGGYWGHKAKREEAEAALAQLKLQERIGVLVVADEVRRSRRETAFKVANALTQLPAKLAPVVAPQDPQRAETLLAEEIDRVLNELAGSTGRAASATASIAAAASKSCQKIKDARLEHCPRCEAPVTRQISAATITRGGPSLNPANIEKHGLTQYKRSGQGVYEKTAGKGPDVPKDD